MGFRTRIDGDGGGGVNADVSGNGGMGGAKTMDTCHGKGTTKGGDERISINDGSFDGLGA